MVNIKELDIETFECNPNRRLINVSRSCIEDRNRKVTMQMQLYAMPEPGKKELMYSVMIDFLGSSKLAQYANFSLHGIQESRLNPYASRPVEDGDLSKPIIDKEYEPWVRSIIELYKEVNQDLPLELDKDLE